MNIIESVKELVAIDREMARLWSLDGHDEEHTKVYHRHWCLREQINGVRARSRDELLAKIEAFEIAHALDPEHECHVPGSARKLAVSVIADMRVMQTAVQSPSAHSRIG